MKAWKWLLFFCLCALGILLFSSIAAANPYYPSNYWYGGRYMGPYYPSTYAPYPYYYQRPLYYTRYTYFPPYYGYHRYTRYGPYPYSRPPYPYGYFWGTWW